MRIEDAEEIFGRRWYTWSEKEKKEFVSCMTLEEATIPDCLMILSEYPNAAPTNIQEWLASVKLGE